MTEWLSGMAAGVANHLWQSTAFAAVVCGATLLLRKNAARVRYGLWAAASAKFLVPFSLLIALGGMLPRPQHAVVTMPVYSAVDEVGLPFSDVETVPVETPTHAAMRPRHEWGTQIAVGLAGVWVCGVVVVLGTWCGGWRKVTRTLRRAVAASEGREVEILRRVQVRVGGRRVRLVLSREWMEPGIFGIWRPVLIWPEGLSARLDDEHVEAIVAHELMHARRRDNLTAALHMLVEAAFWFHPLVWWMERRMVEERERACDEAVVEMGSRPGVYAESLLKAVRFCVESPLVCVAGVTGADLAGRVRSIMTLRLRRLGLAGKLALAGMAVASVAAPVAFGVVRMIPLVGQVLHATGPLPAYEFVVIKPSHEEAHGASTEGDTTHYGVTAKMLIQFAYSVYGTTPGILDLKVVGGPDWINTDVFSIVGKVDAATYEQNKGLSRQKSHEQRQLMEQSLLADRFKLKMHTEMQDQPVYALMVAKAGKLTPAKDATGGFRFNPFPGNAAPESITRGLLVNRVGGHLKLTAKGMSIDDLVNALASQKETNGEHIVNQTGLTGAYDFTLTWGPPDNAAAAQPDEADEPPLFVALQQQLGLKLVQAKAPAEVVVVDHIEKPVLDSADAGAEGGVIANAVAAGQRLLGSLVPVALVQPAQASSAASAVRGEYGVWLDQDARWLITPEERTAFLALTNDQERDDYIQKFWERKGSAAGMSGGAYKAAIYARFAYANEHFASTRPGWSTDRGHIYVVFGKPDEVKAQPANGMETWVYHYVAGVGDNVTLKFVKGPGAADYRLMTPYPGEAVAQRGQEEMRLDARFEVASIRPDNGGSLGVSWGPNTTGYSAHNAPLARVILDAYLGTRSSPSSMVGVPLNRLQGAPTWVMNVPYDIVAKASDTTIEAMADLNQTQRMRMLAPMLRALLEDRFKLAAHMTSIDTPGYALVVGKHGVKMREVPPDEPSPKNGMSFGGSWKVVTRRTVDGKQTGSAFLGIKMGELTAFLGNGGAPLVDQTGLTGKYDVELAMVDVDSPSGGDGSAPAPKPDIAHTYDWEAIGLEMEPIKVPVPSVVIEHIERPSEN